MQEIDMDVYKETKPTMPFCHHFSKMLGFFPPPQNKGHSQRLLKICHFYPVYTVLQILPSARTVGSNMNF